MQTHRFIPAIFTLLVSFAVCQPTDAKEPSAEARADKDSAGSPIGTVNVKQVFDRHAGFQKEVAKLKSEAAKLVKDHARLVNELEARKKQLGRDDLSEEVRKKLNEELLRAQAELATLAPLKQREIREREARLYGTVYKEIQDAVAKLARKHRLQIVLRDHELDAKTLTTGDKSFVILFQEGIDKTEELVQLLNGSGLKSDDQVDADTDKLDEDQLRVAVADLHKIVSAYPKHESRLASLRKRTRDLESDVADEQSKLKDLEAKAKLLDQGSKEFAELAKKFALQKAAAELRLKAKKQQLDAETARAAEQTLTEITHLIGEFSRTHGISLVVNTDTASIDAEDAASVLKGVAKPVVYHANHDISYDIIALMNGGGLDSSGPQADDNSNDKERFGGKVAVIDMAAVYKSNERFAAQMASLQQEIVKFGAYLQNRKGVLEELQSLLNALEEGTEAHQTTSKQLARDTAELKVEMELKKRDLKREEAKVYATTYLEIQATLTRIVRARGVRFVIRFARQPIDPDDQKSVLSGINRTVLFQDKLDLTDEVIRQAKSESSFELR